MVAKNQIMTDKAKFNAACRKRGITAKEAALAIGRCGNIIAEMDMDKLYQTIYSAVYQAVKMVFSE